MALPLAAAALQLAVTEVPEATTTLGVPGALGTAATRSTSVGLETLTDPLPLLLARAALWELPVL